MPGGKRNPLSMSHMLESLGDAVHNAKSNVKERKQSLTQKLTELGFDIPYIDLEIQFIGASGLPKMDVVGSADPYFVAKIDDKITFVSTVKPNNLSPVWNEVWQVRNVPSTADLCIDILDKDEGAVTDDYIGSIKTSITTGTKELDIEGPLVKLRRSRGTFWLKIDTKPSATDPPPTAHPYLFAGPIRFSRHYSPTVGLLTSKPDDATSRLYSTWKIFLPGVPLYFDDIRQGWNRNYKAAQSIFQGPTSIAVRSGIQAGHRMLYARTVTNGFGTIDGKEGFIRLLQGGGARPGSSESPANANRVKPAVYTYIISADDFSFRFSETGAAFFVDFASKHALHSNCAESVVYSGEFHPRPKGGWAAFTDTIPDAEVEWELVIDNNSGTYAPDKNLLPKLEKFLQDNLFGIKVFALDHGDPELKESREACREYAVRCRGVKTEDLQPHLQQPGEVSLIHEATLRAQQGPRPHHKRAISLDDPSPASSAN